MKRDVVDTMKSDGLKSQGKVNIANDVSFEHTNFCNNFNELKSKLKDGKNINPVNEILHNCVDGLKELPDNSIQLFVTSPPYSMDDKRIYTDSSFNDNLEEKENLKLFDDLAKEINRVIKPDGVVCFNMSYNAKSTDLNLKVVGTFIEKGFSCKEQVSWEKTNWQKIREIKHFSRICEPVYILIKSSAIKKSKNGKKIEFLFKTNLQRDHNETNIWKIDNRNVNQHIKKQLKKINPKFAKLQSVAFPVELPKKCIELFTTEGDIVCDPFAGLSTTGVACIETNRKFIGFEKYSEPYEAASVRLNLELKEKNYLSNFSI